ncbi:hypothetical protein ABZ924_08075 [Streptomyces sp. NPDC046876]|uniref:hypothetical protein n=1 Tax=Streptomyces sp. NPDC046876 TaxID=3155616 RepID=UPI0033C90F90
MEHIRALASPAGIGIILFIRATGADTAHVKALRLLAAALASGAAAGAYSVTLHGR